MVAAKKEKQDIAASTAAWKVQVSKLEKYLMTKTEPNLAWLPKTHDDRTSAAIANRHDEVRPLIRVE
jgi:isoleucyl-tRNA synthetase